MAIGKDEDGYQTVKTNETKVVFENGRFRYTDGSELPYMKVTDFITGEPISADDYYIGFIYADKRDIYESTNERFSEYLSLEGKYYQILNTSTVMEQKTGSAFNRIMVKIKPMEVN